MYKPACSFEMVPRLGGFCTKLVESSVSYALCVQHSLTKFVESIVSYAPCIQYSWTKFVESSLSHGLDKLTPSCVAARSVTLDFGRHAASSTSAIFNQKIF